MANTRIKKSTPLLTTQGRRLALLGAAALAGLGLAFAAGVGVGRQLAEKSGGALAADPLAALDAPPRSDGPGAAGEPVKDAAASPGDFSFHQALTDPRPGAQPAPVPEKLARVAAVTPPAPKQPVLTSSVAGAGRDGGAPADGPAQEGGASAGAPIGEAPAASAPPAHPASAAHAPARPAAPPRAPPAPKASAAAPRSPSLAPAPRPKPRLVASARTSEPAAQARGIPAGAFSVQVGSARSLEDAQRIAAKFKGHRPHIVSSEVEGKRWYRVRLGVFESRADAGQYLRESGLKGFVTAAR